MPSLSVFTYLNLGHPLRKNPNSTSEKLSLLFYPEWIIVFVNSLPSSASQESKGQL